MKIEEIEIGTNWEDTLGMAKYSVNGNLVKGRSFRDVTITDKTTNTIEYRDNGGFMSWISIDDFTRIERSNNRMRFEKIK